MQANHRSTPAQDTAAPEPIRLLDLFICVIGFVMAAAGMRSV